MELETKTITPEMAQELLAISKQAGGLNRLKRSHIDELVEEMQGGRFILNGQPIIIAKNGKILDGHHRLTAAYESKCSFTTILITEADENALSTIDQGSSRNVAETLLLSGHKGKLGLLAPLGKAAGWLINYQDSGNPFRPVPPNYVVEEWVRNHQELEEPCMKWVEAIALAFEGIHIPKPLIAFTFLEGALSGQRQATEKFLEKLATGYNIEPGDPEGILRTFFSIDYPRLMHSRNKKQKPSQHTILGRMLKCLRASIDGSKIEKLSLGAREPLPDLRQSSLPPTLSEVSPTTPLPISESRESNEGTQASL